MSFLIIICAIAFNYLRNLVFVGKAQFLKIKELNFNPFLNHIKVLT